MNYFNSAHYLIFPISLIWNSHYESKYELENKFKIEF